MVIHTISSSKDLKSPRVVGTHDYICSYLNNQKDEPMSFCLITHSGTEYNTPNGQTAGLSFINR